MARPPCFQTTPHAEGYLCCTEGYLLQGGDAFVRQAAVDGDERVQVRQHRESLQTLVHDVLAGADVQVRQSVQLGDRLQRICKHRGKDSEEGGKYQSPDTATERSHIEHVSTPFACARW